MLDLRKVNWRRDRITRAYVADHYDELCYPETMKASDLGTAVTYCEDFYNPFAEEIMRRSGHLEKFKAAVQIKEKRQIFDKACRYHGMVIM